MSNGYVNNIDDRIPLLVEAAQRLRRGDYNLDLPLTAAEDEIGQLAAILYDLGRSLESHDQRLRRMDQITARINAGLLLDEVLDNIYEDFCDLIPYDRIGFALIDDDGETVTARWARSSTNLSNSGAVFQHLLRAARWRQSWRRGSRASSTIWWPTWTPNRHLNRHNSSSRRASDHL